MRPLRSVRHSPRLTKMNGVLTRMRAAEHGERHAPEAEIGAVHVQRPSSGSEAPQPGPRAAVEASRWPGCTTKRMPCSTSTVASGRSQPALQQAAAGADAAEQDRDRNDRQRIVAREEGDQDAGVAVAGGERGVGACRARPRPRPCRRGPPRRRQRRRRSARSAADTAGPSCAPARTLPPTTRAAKPNGRDAHQRRRQSRQATMPNDQAPVHVACRGSCRACWRRRSAGSTACSGSPDRAAALRRDGSSARWRCRRAAGWRSSR